MRVFISYRRDDSILSARLLHNELAARFGAEQVFMDLDDIGYGEDFAQDIDRELARAEVVLVVIGPQWAQIIEQRLRGDDWVRHEVASALRMRESARAEGRTTPRVLPVLVAGAVWPVRGLPSDLAPLLRLNALRIDERSLKPHVNALVEAVRQTSFEDEARDLRALLGGRRRAHLGAALVGVLAFLASWIALFDFLGLDTRLASETMQVAGAGRLGPWSGEVVLVAIDERTERAVGRGFDASWRAEHASLIRTVAAAGARSLAFDLVIEEAGPADADRALVGALGDVRATLPVVFGVQRLAGDKPMLHPPVAALAHWGVACAGTAFSRAHSMPLAIRHPMPDGEVLWPSLALAAYSGGGEVEAFGAQTVQVRLPRERRSPSVAFFAVERVRAEGGGDCPVIRSGSRVASQLIDPRSVVPLVEPPRRIAYESVLRGDPKTLAALNDRIVLVGVLKQGEDRSAVAGSGEVRWRAELIAAQIDGLVRGEAVRPVGALASWLLHGSLAIGGASVSIALHRKPGAWRVLASAAAMLVFVIGAVLWYRIERQLVGLPYGLTAIALGSWVAARLLRRGTR